MKPSNATYMRIYRATHPDYVEAETKRVAKARKRTREYIKELELRILILEMLI